MPNKEQWPEGTVISTEGFFSPDGELLSGEPHTQAEVDEWNGTSSDLPATGASATSSASPKKPKKVTENSTKKEMEEEGRKHGIELDRRKGKKTLWNQLKKAINK